MAVFTCITEVRESFHLTQHSAGGPEAALRDHIAALPYDDGAGPFDDELEWLRRVSGGVEPVEFLSVGHCRGTWLWRDGARYEPQYIPYVIRTDVGPDAEPSAAEPLFPQLLSKQWKTSVSRFPPNVRPLIADGGCHLAVPPTAPSAPALQVPVEEFVGDLAGVGRVV